MKKYAVGLLFAAVGLMLVPQGAIAESAAVYQAELSIKQVLKKLTGKRVAIRLRSGQQVNGKLTGVGKQLLHLEQLAGRGYFSEILVLEEVAGVEYGAK